MARWVRRLAFLLRRRRHEDELAEEMAVHREMARERARTRRPEHGRGARRESEGVRQRRAGHEPGARRLGLALVPGHLTGPPVCDPDAGQGSALHGRGGRRARPRHRRQRLGLRGHQRGAPEGHAVRRRGAARRDQHHQCTRSRRGRARPRSPGLRGGDDGVRRPGRIDRRRDEHQRRRRNRPSGSAARISRPTPSRSCDWRRSSAAISGRKTTGRARRPSCCSAMAHGSDATAAIRPSSAARSESMACPPSSSA